MIHLINLRRHRRIEWAAMDFLLESQKRNKKWIVPEATRCLLPSANRGHRGGRLHAGGAGRSLDLGGAVGRG